MTPPIGAEKAYCDPTYTCRQEFEDVRDVYQRNVFVVMVVLGLVSLILGFALAANEAISLGLSYGGILSFIIASIQYWSAMDDYLRVIILALALAILICSSLLLIPSLAFRISGLMVMAWSYTVVTPGMVCRAISSVVSGTMMSNSS